MQLKYVMWRGKKWKNFKLFSFFFSNGKRGKREGELSIKGFLFISEIEKNTLSNYFSEKINIA